MPMGMDNPMMGGGNANLFGGGEPAAGGEKDYTDLFEGGMDEEEGMGDPLMSALESAGYAVTPDKLDQIKSILESGESEMGEGGMAPEGIEPTESGPEAIRSAP